MNRASQTALCLAIVLIGWGVSWELLPYQTGTDDLPEATVPVFYRFLFSGLLFVAFILLRDLRRGQISFDFSLSTWGLVALLGAGFFSVNYSLYYMGQRGLPPGLVSLFFAFVVVTNLILTSLVARRPPPMRMTFAALIGLVGVAAVLSPSIWADGGISYDWVTLRQAGLCLAGTLVVSLATLVQVEMNRRQAPVVTTTAFAMMFGASYVGLYSLWQGYSFDISAEPAHFYSALAVLVLLSSIGGFSAYLKLVGLIGPNRGAYVNLGTAVVALVISYFRGTGDTLTSLQLLGVALILLGGYLILRFKEQTA